MKKHLFLILFFCGLAATAYCQTGDVYICEGIDENNNFIGDDVTVVDTNFIWYFMRHDFKPVGFNEGEVIYVNVGTGKSESFRFGCDGTSPCPYFEDRLDKGKYIIWIVVNEVILGSSKEFEVK